MFDLNRLQRAVQLLIAVTVAVLPALGAVPANGAVKPYCLSAAVFADHLRRQFPDSIPVSLSGEHAAQYIRAVNALLPASNLAPARALLIAPHPRSAMSVLVVGFNGGCYFGHLRLLRRTHFKIMKQLVGQTA